MADEEPADSSVYKVDPRLREPQYEDYLPTRAYYLAEVIVAMDHYSPEDVVAMWKKKYNAGIDGENLTENDFIDKVAAMLTDHQNTEI